MKLNYKRTILVGFAFFLISAFWQAYDTIIPLMLTNKFGLDQTWSGVIMSLDNILALFMLPLFGAISDRKDTRFGKRTPFIVIGAIAAIICFVGLTFADNAQLKKISEGTKEEYWNANYTVENRDYHNITNNGVAETYSVRDYTAKLYFNKLYDDLTDEEKQQAESWYINELNYDTVYVYDKSDDSYRLCKNVNGKTVYTDDGTEADVNLFGNAYSALVSDAEAQFAKGVTKANWWILVLFIAILLAVLISMAVFRSPAVALMPDVTVKPLRSKANAVINLMGTAGGLSVLVLGMIFGTGAVKNQLMSYTWFVLTVCGIMLAALIVFMFTVKEKRWNAEMLAAQTELDEQDAADAPEEQAEAVSPNKLSKDKRISLILILASVALWFTGYNAITSKYSVYALNVLNKDYNSTLMIAQGAAIIAYVPVGMIASKIGRKKSILSGIVMLTAAFFGAIFVTASSPTWLLWIMFALAGIGWATINVNSFPMVVELSKGNDIGKYTGYYYTASMAAQVITPILSGALMDAFGTMSVLFPYGAIFAAASFVTMLFVKHGDSKPAAPKDKLELLGGDD